MAFHKLHFTSTLIIMFGMTPGICYVINRGSFPDHLPVEEIPIYPEGDLSAMVYSFLAICKKHEVDPYQ